jgi:methylthioribose-1-phosphate isomerase
MAASVMNAGKVDAVIVGADRIAANGDVANKIGTLSISILAGHFNVPLFVAAPTSTIDAGCASGSCIPIELRDSEEVACGFGKRTAPQGVNILNPAFDVTPGGSIAAIITEEGILRPPYDLSGHANTARKRSKNLAVGPFC